VVEVAVVLEPSSSWQLVDVVSNGSYSYPSIPPWREDNLINAISLEEDLGAVQSNPTSERFSAQVRRRTRLRSKSCSPRTFLF
jgi:hypothetical protein